MRVNSNPPNTLGYFGFWKNEEKSEGISALFLDDDDEKKASGKPKFEIRNEDGYIRKYVVKANGDKILVMETKQQENPDGTVQNESGDLIDMAHDMLMKQLEFSDVNLPKFDKNVSSWERENNIFKYKTGI
ncbi:hypothetical protein [Sporosarcina trichiuri]|uniref:hypothetical protein n=1 Tax=Sporosarcina trichiuri TaxID=3056445 RepID=UPI0025B4A114|nr:hypothetical protein [Sporosarcina sp. 0.2-SM1T-5]WJY27070.1 hypothetical protein QWT68_13625 [Sporosarcina sp. 0.2-SM1T-5]